jgi:hypothetical protein
MSNTNNQSTYIVLGSWHWEKHQNLDRAFHNWLDRTLDSGYCFANEVWVYRIYGESQELVDKSYIDDMGGLCYHNSLNHKKHMFKLKEKPARKLADLLEQTSELTHELADDIWSQDDLFKD